MKEIHPGKPVSVSHKAGPAQVEPLPDEGCPLKFDTSLSTVGREGCLSDRHDKKEGRRLSNLHRNRIHSDVPARHALRRYEVAPLSQLGTRHGSFILAWPLLTLMAFVIDHFFGKENPR